MNKWFVLVLSAMFAMAPVAVVAEEIPETVESATYEAATDAEIDEFLKEIGEVDDIKDVKDVIEEDKISENTDEPVETVGAEEETPVKKSQFNVSGDRYGFGSHQASLANEFNSSVFFVGESIKDQSLTPGVGFFIGDKINVGGLYEYGVHAANELNINGIYVRDLFAIGNTININEDAALPRDVYMAGGTINVRADIGGSAFLSAKRIVLDNVRITEDLRIAASELEFIGDVEIGGTLVKNDSLNMINSESAKINAVEEYHIEQFDFVIKNKMVLVLIHLATMIVTAVVFHLFAKNFFSKTSAEAKHATSIDVASIFGMGVFFLICMPVIAAVLLITIVGIPAGLILLLAWILFLCLSTTVTASYLGAKVMPSMNVIISTILVLILIVLVNLIPYVNIVFIVAEVAFGLGIIGRELLMKKAATTEK